MENRETYLRRGRIIQAERAFVNFGGRLAFEAQRKALGQGTGASGKILKAFRARRGAIEGQDFAVQLAAHECQRCPKLVTLLIAPDGHTFFELPHNLDQSNHEGFNGVTVTVVPADASYCG